jgi:hypothetical protein
MGMVTGMQRQSESSGDQGNGKPEGRTRHDIIVEQNECF